MGSLADTAKAAGVIFVPIALIIGITMVAGRMAGAVAAFVLFGLVGLGLLLAGAGRLRSWLRIRGTSATTPGRIDPGPVEVEGTARPLADTIDPPRADAETESLVYEHIIKKKRRDHDEDGTREYWETTTNTTEGVPFVVEDTGGEVVVDPDGADVLFEDSFSERGSARREYVRRLDPEETVYVAGEAVRAADADVPTDGRQYAITEPSTRVPKLLRRIYDQPFVIADSVEEEAQRHLFWSGVKVAALALFYNAIYIVLLAAVFGGL